MKKRTFVSIALAVALVLALAAPAFAQSASYSYELDMDGTIDQEMQVGHACNSGAELKQTIMGTGTLTKVLDAAMVPYKLTVSDTNDFVTAADAVLNLTVTSVIELCAPPKMTYEDTITYLGEDYTFEGVVNPLAWYYPAGTGGPPWSMPAFWYGNSLGWAFDAPDEVFTLNNPQDYLSDYEGLELGDYEELTKQIWAVQVEAAPGFSGNLHQDFEAAYGPYYGDGFLGEEDDLPDGRSDNWTWMMDEDGVISPVVGDDYVGNYFNIDQMARTSQGVVKQFYSVSSMWSHGLFTLDSTITGMSEQTEKFSMDNLEPGSDDADNWWSLF